MPGVTDTTGAYSELSIPVNAGDPRPALRVEHDALDKTRNDIYRLIDQQLNAVESGVSATLPQISHIPGMCQPRHRSADARIRKLLAQKLATGEAVGTNLYATSMQTIRVRGSDDMQPAATYELTLRTPVTDSDGNGRIVEQKENRTRAEIELHLLCESSFRLASGAVHAADSGDALTCNELMAPRRGSKRKAQQALSSSPTPIVSSSSAEPTPAQQSAGESHSPMSTPLISPQFTQSNSAHVARAGGVANIYSAVADTTNMIDLTEQLAATHTILPVSATNYNCAWRCAWAMILTQQEPQALKSRLLHLLGNSSRRDAADIKAICERVRCDGLQVIMSRSNNPGRLVYRDDGPEMEQMLNRVAINVMKKSGVAATTAEEFFDPLKMATAEDIARFVHAMGATSAVMQVQSLSNPYLTTLTLRHNNDAVVSALELSPIEDPNEDPIPAANFVQACASLPIARLTGGHFDLLIPNALWAK